MRLLSAAITVCEGGEALLPARSAANAEDDEECIGVDPRGIEFNGVDGRDDLLLDLDNTEDVEEDMRGTADVGFLGSAVDAPWVEGFNFRFPASLAAVFEDKAVFPAFSFVIGGIGFLPLLPDVDDWSFCMPSSSSNSMSDPSSSPPCVGHQKLRSIQNISLQDF